MRYIDVNEHQQLTTPGLGRNRSTEM